MRFTPVLACLLGYLGLTTAQVITKTSASIADGFKIPAGQPDGVYSVSIDNTTGTASHSKLTSSTPPRAFPPQSHITRRQSWQTFPRPIICSADVAMDHQSTDAAVADLLHQCRDDPGVKPKHHFYAVRNGVAVFYCNFRTSEGRHCKAGDLRATLKAVTDKCGWYKPGWSERRDVESYGYHEVGGDKSFCGAGHG